jgi:HSP20 family protein
MSHPLSPVRERDRLPDIVELFRRFARLAEAPASSGEDLRVDLEESDKEFRVRAEIPGARKEELEVRVDGNTLTIAVRAGNGGHPPKLHDGHRVLVSELPHGNRSRSLRLPHEIEEKKVHASFEDGVLRLTCPKRTSGRQNLVAIQ